MTGAGKKRILQEKEAEVQEPEALSIAWPERRTIHKREVYVYWRVASRRKVG